jgi:hypothetical protein
MAAVLRLPSHAANLSSENLGDPIRWLKALKRKYWFGQSFSDMHGQLSSLLLCKCHAERTDQPFSTDTYETLWHEVQAEYDMELPVIIDYRIEETIAFLAKYRISGNNQLWHVMNQAWLDKTCNKQDGQHFTPDFVKRFMIWIYPPAADLRICDPCGGSGGFLTTAADEMDDIEPERFHYYDIDADRALKSAKMALGTYVHKSGKCLAAANVSAQDSLAVKWPMMDRIYTNVPFGVKVSDSNILGGFEVGKTNGRLKRSELSQLLFIEKCLRQLTPSGTFATVVDKGIVTNDKYVRERKCLTKLAHLDLIVELPGVAFEYFAGTTFPTYLLFFRANGDGPTQFAKVENLGYDDRGYLICDGERSFAYEYAAENLRQSDFPTIRDAFRSNSLDKVAYDTIQASGHWHYGAYRHRTWKGRRLRDLATIVVTPWDGRNRTYPTIDREFRTVAPSHLTPKTRTQQLEEGCIFMSRLVSETQTPCCAVVTETSVGMGTSDESYVLRPNTDRDRVVLWYAINFDPMAQAYLQENSKGQGRGRIKDTDLLDMTIPELPDEVVAKVDMLMQRLAKKAKVDALLAKDIRRLDGSWQRPKALEQTK